MSKSEVITKPKQDRRILSNIPDPSEIRKSFDRRGNVGSTSFEEIYQARLQGKRYMTSFPIKLHGHKKIKATSIDISNTGVLIQLSEFTSLNVGETVKLTFKIPNGAMPEGFESKVTIKAKVVREFTNKSADKNVYYGLEFEESIESYLKKRRWGLSIFFSSIFLLVVSLIVLLLRTESVIYFKFNRFLYFYSIMAAAFLLSRYLFGIFYRNVPINNKFEPGVSIIIPAFNEEKWIHRTILSCIDQTYPIDKLEVIIVDDCSTDGTVNEIKRTIDLINEMGERFETKNRLSFYQLPRNAGKREALVAGVKIAKHELVAFVDSDSFLEPNAIRHIVQPFQDPKMGGVSGRTEVENKFTNILTKLQTVRYYIAFRIMKAAESTFDSVTCLSGPLSCYRKQLVAENMEDWVNQKFLGHPATFGDDRSMTNFVLKTHRTGYQDLAVCSTIVPSDYKVFLSQQMRWKRSWLRESLRALTFIYKKEPFMMLFFIIGLVVPIAAPVVVIYNLLYIPLTFGVFPTTFLVGLMLMAMMMSFAHLYFKKSKLWFFGFIFVLFYEFILLWQMPIAWVTFWKSHWGTRETPQDILAKQKKQERLKRWRRKNDLTIENTNQSRKVN